jgi:hypothetical protein
MAPSTEAASALTISLSYTAATQWLVIASVVWPSSDFSAKGSQ